MSSPMRHGYAIFTVITPGTSVLTYDMVMDVSEYPSSRMLEAYIRSKMPTIHKDAHIIPSFSFVSKDDAISLRASIEDKHVLVQKDDGLTVFVSTKK